MKRILILLCLLLLPSTLFAETQLAWMNPWIAGSNSSTVQTIAFDAAATSNGNSISSIAWNHTCSGNNRILIVFLNRLTSAVSSITYNSVAPTGTLWESLGTFRRKGSAYYWIAPDIGTHEISITFGSSQVGVVVASTSYTGVHQTVPYGTAQTAENYGTSVTDDVSSAPGELVIDCVVNETTTSLTPDDSQTTRFAANYGTYKIRGSSKPGETTTTMTWTTPTSWSTIGSINLKPVD